jgi:hypothetical protein
MPIQILTHTPIHVWLILAFLFWRGVLEMREREIAVRRLCVLPSVMLGLSLLDIVQKFGAGMWALGTWAVAGAAAVLLARRFGRDRIAPGAAPDRVRVHGSAAPLALMMAIFLVKYATSVLLAMQPQIAHQLAASVAICCVFGVFNGLLIGRLARDVAAWRGFAHGASAQAHGRLLQS